MSNKIGTFWDLDGVLFNTDEFKLRRILAAEALGISRVLYQDAYEKVKETLGYYDVSKHIELLTKNDQLKADLLRKTWLQVLRNSKDLAYPDSREFLEFVKAQPLPIDRTLVSRGERSLQMSKLIFTDLDKYFTIQEFVGSQSKGSVIVNLIREFKYKVAIFVDDTLNELRDVQRTINTAGDLNCIVYLIWLNRKAKTKAVASLLESGYDDPLSNFSNSIIPVPDFYTLQKLFPLMLQGGSHE